MLTTTPTIEAPATLSAAASAKWDEVNRDFQLEPHHLTLLEGALTHWDLWREAISDIQQRGAECKNRLGDSRDRDAVGRAERNWNIYLKTMRELALDVSPPADAGRLPRSSARYGGRA